MATAIFYSTGSTLTTGVILYKNSACTTIVDNGAYSDGTNCFTVSGSNGAISTISACATPTPTPTPTAASTDNPQQVAQQP